MLKHRLKFIFLLFIFMSSFLTACWDSTDINHRLLPIVLGISKEKKDYKVYLQIPHLTEESIKNQIIIGNGTTISQAVNQLSIDLESTIDLLHVKVIVVERKLAEEGMKDLISGFIRSRTVSPKAIIAISDGDISELFSMIEKKEVTESSLLLNHFEKDSGWDPEIALTRLWQLFSSIHSSTRDTVIPMINIGKSQLVEQIGSAIIRKGKMVGQIDSIDTLLYNAFIGEVAHERLKLTDSADVLILNNSVKNTSRIVNHIPILNSKFKFKVMLLETKGNPTSKKIINELEESVYKRFTKLFQKLQNAETDILGIGEFYRDEIPRSKLRNWRSSYYPKVKFNLHVKFDIDNNGNLLNTSN